MDENKFGDQSSGKLIPTLFGIKAFLPNDLPPSLDMNLLALPVSNAMLAIGELRGACRRLSNPYILIQPLQRREALTSSAMEGTFTSDDDLLFADTGLSESKDQSTKEVNNYLRALREAVNAMQNDGFPISHRLIKNAHRTLLSGVGPIRGANKHPGEYKSEQNAIGGLRIEDARYVPPPPNEAQNCMDILEKYINRENTGMLPAIIDLALVHYQIEAIHPFSDGNGRVGRILISLMAIERKLLDMPVLYMSPALEGKKDQYIDLMFNVSANGDWTSWVTFFLKTVEESCAYTIKIIDNLIALQEDYRNRVTKIMRSAKAVSLVDYLFFSPAITVPKAKDHLNITYRAAKNIIDKLVEAGILKEFSLLHPTAYLAPAIIRAADAKFD